MIPSRPAVNTPNCQKKEVLFHIEEKSYMIPSLFNCDVWTLFCIYSKRPAIDNNIRKGGEMVKVHLQQKDTWSLRPTDILFQTVYWSEVKSRLGWKTFAFDFASLDTEADILVLLRDFGHGITGAYIQQGPEYGPPPEHYGLFLEKLSEEMVKHLDMPISFIRYDLPWESQYITCADDITKYQGGAIRPEPRLQELRMNFGTKSWNLRKAAIDITVADAVMIDLARTEAEILSDMKSKTRYNIRLAKRRGVEIVSLSIDMLPVFYDLYRQTAERNKFFPCSYKYFSALFSALQSSPDSSEIYFLIAKHNQEALAGAIIGISGKVATYLFGASSNQRRNLMGPYAVQWAGILLAREKGCLAYDMGAVSPTKDKHHPFYGMYRFKTGFGGKIIHRSGTWDYPLDPDKYLVLRNAEALDRGTFRFPF